MFTKKILTLSLSVILIAALFSMAFTVSAYETTADFDKWDGTTVDVAWYDSTNPSTSYEIDAAAKLAGLAKLTNDAKIKDPGAFKDVTFYITKNFDLCGYQWTPIGISNDLAFAGTLEGKLNGTEGASVIIANMTIGTAEKPNTTKNIGLVGSHGAGGIKNITLKGAYINTSVNTVGSFVGYSRPQTTGTACLYSNLKSDATIICGATQWVGGIVANTNNTGNIFRNCVYTGTITLIKDNQNCGGITGGSGGTVATTYENCYSSATISATAGYKRMGGITGQATGITTFTDCQFDGIIIGGGTQNGSMVGRYDCGYPITFTRCINSGVCKKTRADAVDKSDFFTWIGLVANNKTTGTLIFTDCCSFANISLMSRNDYAADTPSTYNVTINGTDTSHVAANANTLISYKANSYNFELLCGDAAKTTLANYTFSDTAWATRSGMYPVLACAAQDAATEYADADMAWFNPSVEEYYIANVNQLKGLDKISQVYDFSCKTLYLYDSLEGSANSILTGDTVALLTIVHNPDTGDNLNAFIYIVTMLVLSCGAVTVWRMKKHFSK